MSLRNRLIIAFLCLSVVPLSAVTAFWYASSVNAFERAAEREATQTAAEIGRRMEMITSAVGRRVDRMFEDADENPDPDFDVDPVRFQTKVAPMLGDTAALVDRVEFHPTSGPEPPPLPPPPAPAGTRGPAAPRPPLPPKVIVVDVPKMVAQARRAAQERAGSPAASAALEKLGPVIESALTAGIPAVEASFAAIAEAASRESAPAGSKQIDMQVSGPKIEVAVRKHGKMVGKANAIMNLDHTLRPVLALARREQGEIPFAIDQQGTVFTPDPRQKVTLDGLKIKESAVAASGGTPRRVGDWIVVARKDKTGLLFGIARPIAESLKEIRRMSWRNLSIGLAVIALACIGIVPISHRMTQHVSSLSEGVRQLANGDFTARVPVSSKDEFGALAAAFNTMAADLERNQTLVVERERLRRELELSRLIQTEMLPRAPLRLGAAEIKGVSIPAREVGGDFFNYFALPDGRLALLVGDVSGKGVSAALLMANVQATLRARLPLETELARLAAGLDVEVDANTPRGVYLTLFLGILDVERGLLQYVNAGHNPQFLLRAAGGIQPLSSTGMPIALYPGQGYKESRVQIGRGDLLFFYTDGLVETENDRGDMFGAERLQALLEAEHAHGIDTVLERVEHSVRAFRGKAEPFDDATMMALRVEE